MIVIKVEKPRYFITIYLYIFLTRLWSSGCRSRYQGGIGRLKFLKRPFCIIGKLLDNIMYLVN